MSLARHIREERWTSLEEAWTELILGDAEPEAALEALRVAADKKALPRCLALVRDHADILRQGGRPRDAAHLLGTAMLLGGSPGELAKPLFESASLGWGEEDFWPAFVEIADLREATPDMRKAWSTFHKLLQLEEGRVVYHAKGWGLGRIQRLNFASLELRVEFVSGRTDRFPFQTAVEIFEILDADDLRSLVVTDPERLQKLIRNEPLEVLRWIVRRQGGRANHAGIKLAMTPLGVEGGRFSSWWRKASKLAETSEWFELSGPTARAQVRLLDRAADPAEGLRRQLARSRSLGEALARVKTILSGAAVEDDVRAVALDVLERLSADPSEELPQRLVAWLALREESGRTPAVFAEMLRQASEVPEPSDPSQPPELWALFLQVPGQREQERCIDLLREIYGDPRWLDEAARYLPHGAPGMARPLVEALETAGRSQELVAHYVGLLARPTRNPTMLVCLAERIETGAVTGDLPPAVQRAQCLLQLAVHLQRNAAGNALLTRTRARLTALLALGAPPVLQGLLEGTDRANLRALANMIVGSVEGALDRVFTRVAVQLVPGVFRDDDKPFWRTGGIWTTRRGLRSHEEELRVLRDVKIPANSEAIGKAASYGDLSENSEWESAIEEQRNLTTRAMQIEAEIREARLIENASLPDDTVCPGTSVRYRDLEAGGEHEIRILGPWDGDLEGAISYRSPLADGMLGLKPGQQATIQLPTGTTKVQVLAVEPIELGTRR